MLSYTKISDGGGGPGTGQHRSPRALLSRNLTIRRHWAASHISVTRSSSQGCSYVKNRHACWSHSNEPVSRHSESGGSTGHDHLPFVIRERKDVFRVVASSILVKIDVLISRPFECMEFSSIRRCVRNEISLSIAVPIGHPRISSRCLFRFRGVPFSCGGHSSGTRLHRTLHEALSFQIQFLISESLLSPVADHFREVTHRRQGLLQFPLAPWLRERLESRNF